MEVKELARIIKERNVEMCFECPLSSYGTLHCKLHGDICMMYPIVAECLLQLEEFFETGVALEILEEEKND